MTDAIGEDAGVAVRGLRVLVCGGRGYGYMPRGIPRHSLAWLHAEKIAEAQQCRVIEVLDSLGGVSVIINGAARGADERAVLWAQSRGVRTEPYPANWYPKGRLGGLDKSAGPRRNQRMIDEGKPDLVVAFPGGKGTADMIRRAEAAAIPVRRVEG